MPHNVVNEGNQKHSKVKAVFPGKGMKGFLFINLPSYQKGKSRRDCLDIGPCNLQPRGGVKGQYNVLLPNPHLLLKTCISGRVPDVQRHTEPLGKWKTQRGIAGIQRAGGLNLDWKSKAIYDSNGLVCSRCFSKSHTLQVSLYLCKQGTKCWIQLS